MLQNMIIGQIKRVNNYVALRPQKHGKIGLVGIQECDHFLTEGEKLLEGNVGFFMSPTPHSLSNHAWHDFMEFMRIHKK